MMSIISPQNLQQSPQYLNIYYPLIINEGRQIHFHWAVEILWNKAFRSRTDFNIYRKARSEHLWVWLCSALRHNTLKQPRNTDVSDLHIITKYDSFVKSFTIYHEIKMHCKLNLGSQCTFKIALHKDNIYQSDNTSDECRFFCLPTERAKDKDGFPYSLSSMCLKTICESLSGQCIEEGRTQISTSFNWTH